MLDLPQRRLGNTSITASRLAFGGIPIGRLAFDAAAEVLNAALDRGINLFDTSWNYDASEAHIGRALSHRRAEFALASKTAQRTRDGAREELEKSLALCRTDHFDLYMAHSVSTLEVYEEVVGPGGAYETLARAREQGLVRHVGLSIHRDLRVMRRAVSSGLWEAVMLSYSVIDQENVGREILPLAKENGLGVLAMKSLGGGGLVPVPEEGFTQEECRRVARDCIRFVLSNPHVDVAPVGVANLGELDAAVEAAQAPPLAEEEVDRLRRSLARIRRAFRYGQVCLRCGYCQPCPQGVPIPDIFRAADAYKGYGEDLRPLAQQMYRDLCFEPPECIECNECLEKCPAGIRIPERLRQIARAFDEADADLL